MSRGLLVFEQTEWLQNDGRRSANRCVQFTLFLLLDQHFGQLLASRKPFRPFSAALQGVAFRA